MKRVIIFVLLLCAFVVKGQQFVYDTIVHDGFKRSFILYVPATYSAGTDVPLIMNFHGYGSNAFEQMFYGSFLGIADTAGFLVVHPNGTLDSVGQQHWNADWGGTVDDIGFTESLIDSISLEYSIDNERVYSTGMSNGGFMSYTLACHLSNRIAAIASVTGSMVVTQISGCNSQHPIPVMEIHGTADGTVPYNGIPGMVEPIENVLNYWINFNQCDTTSVFSLVPDVNTSDGCTAEHYLYPNGDNGVEVEHYKIIGGGHTWPGAPVLIGVTNYDINASVKIWEFFNKYDINGKIISTGIATSALQKFEVYPNPARDYIKISIEKNSQLHFKILDLSGSLIETVDPGEFDNVIIPLTDLIPGMYILQIIDANSRLFDYRKIIKL